MENTAFWWSNRWVASVNIGAVSFFPLKGPVSVWLIWMINHGLVSVNSTDQKFVQAYCKWANFTVFVQSTT